MSIRKLFVNARIYTPFDEGEPLAGEKQGALRIFESGALLAENGIILSVGDEKEVRRHAANLEIHEEVDCRGMCMVPGFVDPHTHICFAETRETEFSMRLSGVPYLEILEKGGGILSSVRSLREMDSANLFEATKNRVLSALSLGTTTIEIKTGYGLDMQNELKMLEVIQRIRGETPLDVAITFMGAHAVPSEYKGREDLFVNYLVEEMLPAIAERGIADFCDVFCEKGVFSIDQSRRILMKARELGMGIKIHADEVHDLGGAGLAAELEAVSAEHLLAANESNLAKMADKGTIAVLLPCTAYSLKKPFAHARKMIDLKLPVAVATDCNPGSCFCESMPFVFGLSVLQMNMSVEETLVASTLNSAYAIGKNAFAGSLQEGKRADFLLLEGRSPAIFAYHAGVSPVKERFIRGERIVF
ncbi:MAG TPA: imidazolonepropionase [Synergistaceae bacterium]|nr:imidazolonepropionase [Synergistaceae bacterium]HPQ36200.1 imidazolonepropionase [Synergistaceae bacterium]